MLADVFHTVVVDLDVDWDVFQLVVVLAEVLHVVVVLADVFQLVVQVVVVDWDVFQTVAVD